MVVALLECWSCARRPAERAPSHYLGSQNSLAPRMGTRPSSEASLLSLYASNSYEDLIMQ